MILQIVLQLKSVWKNYLLQGILWVAEKLTTPFFENRILLEARVSFSKRSKPYKPADPNPKPPKLKP